jgi:hypothetical protein
MAAGWWSWLGGIELWRWPSVLIGAELQARMGGASSSFGCCGDRGGWGPFIGVGGEARGRQEDWPALSAGS